MPSTRGNKPLWAIKRAFWSTVWKEERHWADEISGWKNEPGQLCSNESLFQADKVSNKNIYCKSFRLNSVQSAGQKWRKAFGAVLCPSFNEEMLSTSAKLIILQPSSLQLLVFLWQLNHASKLPPIDPVIFWPAENDSVWSFWKMDLQEFGLLSNPGAFGKSKRHKQKDL